MNKESAIPWQKSIFVNKTIRHKKSPPLNHPNENNLVGINVDLQIFIHHFNTVHYTSTSAHHVQLLFITTVTPSGFVTENLAVLSAQVCTPSTRLEGRRSIPMYDTHVTNFILPVCFLEKGSVLCFDFLWECPGYWGFGKSSAVMFCTDQRRFEDVRHNNFTGSCKA